MKRIHILVEGQTEEGFANQVLAPHLASRGLILVPILVSTKRSKGGRKFRGGVTSYDKVRRDLRNLLRDSAAVAVTTMFDLSGLPPDFPGSSQLPSTSCWDRVEHLEQALLADLGDPRLVPYLSLHEFEALLFVAPEEFCAVVEGGKALEGELTGLTSGVSPEEIDDGPDTHPSARLTKLAPAYSKALHGPLAATRIGLDRIRRSCPHFHQWITKLEALGG